MWRNRAEDEENVRTDKLHFIMEDDCQKKSAGDNEVEIELKIERPTTNIAFFCMIVRPQLIINKFNVKFIAFPMFSILAVRHLVKCCINGNYCYTCIPCRRLKNATVIYIGKGSSDLKDENLFFKLEHWDPHTNAPTLYLELEASLGLVTIDASW